MRILREACNANGRAAQTAQALDLWPFVLRRISAQRRTLARFVEQEPLSWSKGNASLRDMRKAGRALFNTGKNFKRVDLLPKMQHQTKEYRGERKAAQRRLHQLRRVWERVLQTAVLCYGRSQIVFCKVQSSMAGQKSDYKKLRVLRQRIQGSSKPIGHKVLFPYLRIHQQNKASYRADAQWAACFGQCAGLSDNLRAFTPKREYQWPSFGAQVYYGK